MSREPVWLSELRAAVGPPHVLTDPDETAGYARDWTGRYVGATPAVVRPADAGEVVAVLAVCRAHGIAVVPQGGNTGLVGGSVPLHGEVVLSLARLAGLEVDGPAAQVVAGAGVTIAAVQQAAARAGWQYGVDWAARDSATVGGSVATNAGGVRVLRHGDTRANLVGVEAVLADGSTVSRMGGLLKDNTGYHLSGLLCGSEGTLGVVTAARLRLVRRHDERVVALAGFATVDEAVGAVAVLRRELDALEAIELMLRAGLELVAGQLGAAPPIDAPVVLLVEAAADQDPTAALAAALDACSPTGVAVAVDAGRRAELWRWREAHTEAVNRLGPPIKLDVTLPAAALAPFVDEVPATVGAVAPQARVWLFGHAGDGNVHVNVTGWQEAEAEAIEERVLGLVVAASGSISAEHGIGTAKRRWLALDRSPADLAAMRAIKRALDPDGILNPACLL